MAVKLTQLPI